MFCNGIYDDDEFNKNFAQLESKTLELQLQLDKLNSDIEIERNLLIEEISQLNEDLTEMTNIDYGIQLQMININSIDSFTNLWGMIKPCEVESISEVISLESVLKLCERTFTNFKEIEISDVRIMYTINPVYDNDELGNHFVASYRSRPVWELIIDVSPEEFLTKGETNTYGDMRKYIYVDMVTGEIKYNLDIVKQGIGG